MVSYWNPKAKLWVEGRRRFPSLPASKEKTIWMHCASLGEAEQGKPLLEAIKKQYPNLRIVLTFFSPSGYEVIKNCTQSDADSRTGAADHVFYLPMDTKK